MVGVESGSHRGTRSRGVRVAAATQNNSRCRVSTFQVRSPERCLLRCILDVHALVNYKLLSGCRAFGGRPAGGRLTQIHF